MTAEFKSFLEWFRASEENGTIETSEPLTDFHLAVQFAIGKLHDVGMHTFTTEDVWYAINIFCGKDVWEGVA